jgi:hypothetical protein
VALSVIIILYAVIGLMSAAGSVFIAKKLFSAKIEQVFFALFLIPIAAFYLAFTAYFGDEAAWRFETAGVIGFALLGLLGVFDCQLCSSSGTSSMAFGMCCMRCMLTAE